jgi:diguanylate cyclase
VLSLLVIDIDHFKRINDTHGHAGGDAVLAAVAGVLHHACRSTDLVARTGGEEFLVLLPETDVEGACRVAEKLRATVETLAPPPVGRVTVSVGVASSADAGATTAVETVALADAALYRAKQAGRNRVLHGCLPPPQAANSDFDRSRCLA